jgi:NADH:quinone reductase (non-electrogenic)
MRDLSPALIGWLLFSFFLGTLTQVARQISKQLLRPESLRRVLLPSTRKIEIVILGGGFAGVTTAEQLEKQLRDDPTVAFTLVSETNSWLFTPMLVEVARKRIGTRAYHHAVAHKSETHAGITEQSCCH